MLLQIAEEEAERHIHSRYLANAQSTANARYITAKPSSANHNMKVLNRFQHHINIGLA